MLISTSEKVTGPASATDNALVRYDGTTGKLVQNSGVTVDDNGNLTVNGTAGFGVAPGTVIAARAGAPTGTDVGKYAFAFDGTYNSNTTSFAVSYLSQPATQAASFTLVNLTHFRAAQGTFGAGSTVANQYGFVADAGLTGATNNYGYLSAIPAGTNRWNFYASGTADNFFAGNVAIGAMLSSASLHVAKNITGATSAYGVRVSSTAQADVTTNAVGFSSAIGTAAPVTNVQHYRVDQGALTGAVTTQVGFFVAGGLTGATNNYGFQSSITAGAGRYNFYAPGNAANLFAGDVQVGGGTLGYTAGSGGTVTQITSKSTGVTLNKPCGQITMHNAALANLASVDFILNNSTITTQDVILAHMNSSGNYTVDVLYSHSGYAGIRVTNISGASQSQSPVINFAVIKGATT